MPTPSSDPRLTARAGDESRASASTDPRPDLAALYSTVTARQGDRTDCPSSDALVQFQSGALSSSQRMTLVRHLADCSDCSNELRALAEHPSARAVEAVPTLGIRQRPLLRWSMLGAAAGLILTLSLGIWQARLGPTAPLPAESPPRLRSGEASASVQPPPNAELATAPTQLRWHSQEGTVGERVQLLNSRGDLLLDQRSSVTGALLLEEAVLEHLRSGGRFVWTVERADGSRIGPQWFVIGAGPASAAPQEPRVED